MLSKHDRNQKRVMFSFKFLYEYESSSDTNIIIMQCASWTRTTVILPSFMFSDDFVEH